MAKLFRKEAMDWKGSSWLGIVQLRPKASFTYYACICGVLVFGLATLLIAGSYSQRLKLGGVLISDPAVSRSEAAPTQLFAQFVVPATAIVTLGPRTSAKLTFLGLSSRDQTPLIGRIVSVAPMVKEGAASKEAYFAIIVQLPQQSVSIRGRTIPLSAGLTVSADILIEKRTLLAWLTKPRVAT